MTAAREIPTCSAMASIWATRALGMERLICFWGGGLHGGLSAVFCWVGMAGYLSCAGSAVCIKKSAVARSAAEAAMLFQTFRAQEKQYAF
jgi:hypothetical protein